MPAARRRHPRFFGHFDRLFDRLPVRISTSDLHHWIQRKKIFHIRAYDFGVQFSFNEVRLLFNESSVNILDSDKDRLLRFGFARYQAAMMNSLYLLKKKTQEQIVFGFWLPHLTKWNSQWMKKQLFCLFNCMTSIFFVSDTRAPPRATAKYVGKQIAKGKRSVITDRIKPIRGKFHSLLHQVESYIS